MVFDLRIDSSFHVYGQVLNRLPVNPFLIER